MTNASNTTVTLYYPINQEQLRDIQRLRYLVYAQEMQLELPSMDHVLKLLPDSMDSSSIHLYATTNGTASGAVRLTHDAVPPGLEESLDLLHLSRPFIYCSRFFVLPEWRGTEVMHCLTRACFDYFAQAGAAVAICHCYPHLRKLYRRMGFRPYGTSFAIPGLERLGEQTPLCCRLKEGQFAGAA